MNVNSVAARFQCLNSRLGFGIKFSPITKEEAEEADMQVIWDVFREASKNNEKYLLQQSSISDGLFGYTYACYSTECFPKEEVVRVTDKIRKNPEYGEKLLDKIIEKSKNLPDMQKKATLALVEHSKKIIKHPEFKDLVKIQNQIAEAVKMQQYPISVSCEEYEQTIEKLPELNKTKIDIVRRIKKNFHSCLS